MKNNNPKRIPQKGDIFTCGSIVVEANGRRASSPEYFSGKLITGNVPGLSKGQTSESWRLEMFEYDAGASVQEIEVNHVDQPVENVALDPVTEKILVTFRRHIDAQTPDVLFHVVVPTGEIAMAFEKFHKNVPIREGDEVTVVWHKIEVY